MARAWIPTISGNFRSNIWLMLLLHGEATLARFGRRNTRIFGPPAHAPVRPPPRLSARPPVRLSAQVTLIIPALGYKGIFREVQRVRFFRLTFRPRFYISRNVIRNWGEKKDLGALGTCFCTESRRGSCCDSHFSWRANI